MSSDSSAREWKRLEPTEPVTVPRACSHGAGVGARPQLGCTQRYAAGARKDAKGLGWHTGGGGGCGARGRGVAGARSDPGAAGSGAGAGGGQGLRPRVPAELLQPGSVTGVRGCTEEPALLSACPDSLALPRWRRHGWESPRCSPGTSGCYARLPHTEQVPMLTGAAVPGSLCPCLCWCHPLPSRINSAVTYRYPHGAVPP